MSLQVIGHYLVLLSLQYDSLELPPILRELGDRADEPWHKHPLTDLTLVEIESDLLQFLRCALVYLEHNIYFPFLATLSLHQAIMWQELVPKDLIDLAYEFYRFFTFCIAFVRSSCSNLEKLDSRSNY